MKYYYPFDPRIHNFGNTGRLGRVHAELAPFFTKAIDNKAYNGVDIRKEIYRTIPNEYNVLDICCGVGLSTRKNPNNYKIKQSNNKYGFTIGIDTSTQMINKAKKMFDKTSDTLFFVGNAENFGQVYNFKCDIVTCMFAFHEMPEYAHNIIIENSLRLAKKEVLIIDIAPNYKSNFIMRSGEPFLLEYKKTIQSTMQKYNFNETIIIPNHVYSWKYLK